MEGAIPFILTIVLLFADGDLKTVAPVFFANEKSCEAARVGMVTDEYVESLLTAFGKDLIVHWASSCAPLVKWKNESDAEKV